MIVNIYVDAAEAFYRLREIMENCEGIPEAIEDPSTEMMDSMVALAQYYCPIDTGRLQSSIHYIGNFPDFILIANAVNPQGQAYAGYVEFGTSKMAAQPFMWPAVREIWEDYRQILQENIRRYIFGRF